MLKKSMLLMLTAAALCTGAVQAKNVGMPNPIVEYNTYQEAANVTGFAPLYLPEVSGYACDYISVISGKTADLGFSRMGDSDVTLRVRTALNKNAGSNLSGVYSVDWDKETIGDTEVRIAQIDNLGEEYVAMWRVGDYTFSAQSKGLSGAAFRNILENGLVDTSTHYFNKLEKQKK